MEQYLFRPDNCFFGDCMPFYQKKDNQFYLYFQKDTRNPIPFGDPFGWELATTSDFVKYKTYGKVLKKGQEDSEDQFIYAGSVFEKPDDKISAYYTGYNRNFVSQNRPSQVLLKASSTDGITWTKEGKADKLAPQEGYDPDNWRDPNVVWNEETNEYLLILGTRLKSDVKKKTGRLVYYTSKDCKDWSFKGDFWTPDLYTMIEMPQLFKEGDWWYLVYSEYDLEKTTHYVMSKKIMGPWIIPEQDTFSGRAYYAARTATNGKERFLFGWVPSKEAGKDENNYLWGGTFLPLEVKQNKIGELDVAMPHRLKAAVKEKVSFHQQEISSPFRRSEVPLIGGISSKSFLLKNKISFKPSTRSFSIIFCENPETGEGYEFNIDLKRQELSVRRTPNLRWYQMLNIGLTRQVKLKPETDYEVSLFVDDTVAVMEIAGTVLSCRIEKNNYHGLSLSVVDGSVTVK